MSSIGTSPQPLRSGSPNSAAECKATDIRLRRHFSTCVTMKLGVQMATCLHMSFCQVQAEQQDQLHELILWHFGLGTSSPCFPLVRTLSPALFLLGWHWWVWSSSLESCRQVVYTCIGMFLFEYYVWVGDSSIVNNNAQMAPLSQYRPIKINSRSLGYYYKFYFCIVSTFTSRSFSNYWSSETEDYLPETCMYVSNLSKSKPWVVVMLKVAWVSKDLNSCEWAKL
jgi:hypothetical protein